jgi:glycosyltransferase involved in cell wall biosynthesis
MKILMLCSYKGNLGDAIRINKIYEHLSSISKDVDIFNLSHLYTPRYKLLKNPDIVFSFLKGIKSPRITKTNIFIKLGIDNLKKIIDKHKPDIILSEGIHAGYIAVKTVKDMGIPVITDLHGAVVPEYLENPNRKVSSGFLQLIRDIEIITLEESERIFVVSKCMKEYLNEQYGTSENKITVVPNGADIQKETAVLRKPMRVVYGGIFAFWEDIDTYLDLAKLNKTSVFYIAGSGPLEKHVKKRIQNEKIPIFQKGSLKRSDAISFFKKMNIGVAPSVKTLTRRVACPIKVFDYMSCGLPVITPDYGEWAEIIKRNDCGVVTKESNVVEFNDALISLEDKKTWEEKSQNAIDLIKNEYNWDKILERIDKFFK